MSRARSHLRVATSRAEMPLDPRVQAVRAVLRGERLQDVARRAAVDPSLVRRWVQHFTEAGDRAVMNVPDPDAARQRDRFLAAFAHELRTPLTVARGWVGVLDDDEMPMAQVQGIVRHVATALETLHERTEDLELLAAASLGRVRLHCEVVMLHELGSPDLADLSSGERAVSVYVDPDRFRRVLRDIASAASMEPTPHQLTITARQLNGGGAELIWRRHGTPLHPEILRGLFEPFDLHDDASGITMGLYLARALVVAHRGTLGVDQDDETTSFWVRLPSPTEPIEE